MGAGVKNGPLFFQVRSVKEPGYSQEASALQVAVAGEAVGSQLAFVGFWGGGLILNQVTYVCGLPRTHSTVVWRLAFRLCHGR